MTKPTSTYELDNQRQELHQSAVNLTTYACIVTSRHIRDTSFRTKFNRDFAYHVRQILINVENGKLTVSEGLQQVELEHKSFQRKALEVGGLITGASMVITGAGICYGSALTACALGAPMAAHGVNNVYENATNLASGRTDAVGPLRKIYHGVAATAGGGEKHGNIAYGVVDIGLSGYGVLRLVKKPGAWQLFKSIRSDKVRAFRTMNKSTLFLEMIMSTWTTYLVSQEFEK